MTCLLRTIPFSPQWPCFKLLLGLIGFLSLQATRLSAEEYFVLSVPSNPNLQSQAVLEGRFLSIIDPQGTRFDYVHDPKFDTPDGEYLGYYSPKAQQFIRWPANDAGILYIGTPPGPNWRPSRMQIQRLRRPGPRPQPPGDPPVPRPHPNDPPPPGDPLDRDRPTVSSVREFTPAVIQQGPNSLVAAYITPQGHLHFCQGGKQEWTHKEFVHQLVPGAPLLLVPDQGGNWPLVYTVNRQGELVVIQDGQREQAVAPNVLFPTSAWISRLPSRRGLEALLVDQRGRLWQVDLTGQQRPQVIEQRPGRYVPGSPMAVAGTQEPDFYIVDASGSLVQYVKTGEKWYGPTLVRQGYQPGSHLAAIQAPLVIGDPPRTNVILVDRRGQLQWLTDNGQQWRETTPLQARFAPGSAVDLISTSDGLMLSAVTQEGNWMEWEFSRRGQWIPREISEGFNPGAPLALAPWGPHGLAIDPTGRMIASYWGRGGWDSVVLLPSLSFSPRLVSRKVIANRPLDPARILLTNSHNEELIVQINDAANPNGPQQINIPPGETIPFQAPRDAGAVLEEVYLVPTPSGPVEEVHRHEIPPQPLQTLVVYVKATTYKYIDKRKDKPQGALPNFDLQTPISLGVLDLPPGELLRDGTVIDVYQAAEFQRNPGAARWFQPPLP